MSLIDDVVGKKLPTGSKFQAKVGTGNVKNKLRSAVVRGALSNLKDNQDLINEIASKRQADIRAGKYDSYKRKADYQAALKDKTLTKDDKRDLKAILDHWGKGEVTKKTAVKKPSAAATRRAAAKARIKPSVRRELPDFLKKRGSISTNPWAKQDHKPGSGGGINNPQGGGSLASSSSFSNKRSRPPSLLR